MINKLSFGSIHYVYGYGTAKEIQQNLSNQNNHSVTDLIAENISCSGANEIRVDDRENNTHVVYNETIKGHNEDLTRAEVQGFKFKGAVMPGRSQHELFEAHHTGPFWRGEPLNLR